MLIYDSLSKGSFFFVSSYLEGRVYKVGLGGDLLNEYRGFKNPLALSSSGTAVYFLDVGTIKLYKYFEEEDRWVEESLPQDISHPYWIAYKDGGPLFVDKDKRWIAGISRITPSCFSERFPYLFDMPSSIKLSSKGIFILADGERALLELSLAGEVLGSWRLPSSPISWTVLNGKPYLLCKGLLFSVEGKALIRHEVNPDFKVVLSSSGSLLLWDGKGLMEFEGRYWNEEIYEDKPYRVILCKASPDDRVDSFKALVESIVGEEKKLEAKVSDILEGFLKDPTSDNLLILNSRILPLEFKINRIYPNIVQFLFTLDEASLVEVYPQIFELIRISLVSNRLWYLPWEVYWRIPRDFRREFLRKTFDFISFPFDVEKIRELLNLTLAKIKENLESSLDRDHKERGFRDLRLFAWVNRLLNVALLLNGDPKDIADYCESFVSWRGGIDYLKYLENQETRWLLYEVVFNVWSLNSFLSSVAEKGKGWFKEYLSRRGDIRDLGDFLFAAFATTDGDSFFVSDWGEGKLYRVSCDGEILWEREVLSPHFTLLRDKDLYLSRGFFNSIFILDSESGEMKEKVSLPEGAKANKLFKNESGDVFCVYHLGGRFFLKNLDTDENIISSPSYFTYLSHDDTYLLSYPGHVYSYVNRQLRVLFDPGLLTPRDWVYDGKSYVVNLTWFGGLKAFRMESGGIRDMRSVRGDYVYYVIPLSLREGKLTVFHPFGYVEEVKV